MSSSLLEDLWKDYAFTPNSAQRQAILHLDGPLYLPAGPGSGKTRVLLWRCVNLIAVHGVAPEQIFLSTFTEKAATQLKEGMRALLGAATNHTGQPYDVEAMFVGTVHSLCQRVLTDRRFTGGAFAGRPPILLDALGQCLNLYQSRRWNAFWDGHWSGDSRELRHELQKIFNGRGASRFAGVSGCLSFFDRLSEECFDAGATLAAHAAGVAALDEPMVMMLRAYQRYCAELKTAPARTDFALLQQEALRVVQAHAKGNHVPFAHVIVDEYQDTNTVQERLYFALAGGSRNLCVVGDDDQALYRFRGATVESFVQFPSRCRAAWGVAPQVIPLETNYRSRAQIVRAYEDFMARCDWGLDGKDSFFRVEKEIVPYSSDLGPSVVTTRQGNGPEVAAEIAAFVKKLLDERTVQDPSQIAFLFPSVKSPQSKRLEEALEAVGLKVYAPRARSFLYTEEATALFGIFCHIFGKAERDGFGSGTGSPFDRYYDWIDAAHERAGELLEADPALREFVFSCQREIARSLRDDALLRAIQAREGWRESDVYQPESHKTALLEAEELSEHARAALQSEHFDRIAAKRAREGAPFRLGFVLQRATVLDWNLLDLFYQLCGFAPLLGAFELAEKPVGEGRDEGPLCNLSLISRYLARFAESYANLLTARFLSNERLIGALFSSYLNVLFQREEGEFEDEDDPFPLGRIPFLTIHQAKGLEFPVVILGNTAKQTRVPHMETLVRPLLPPSSEREPLDRLPGFDAMRLFYVAFSRAQNLLVIPNMRGQGIAPFAPIKALLAEFDPPLLSGLDVSQIPRATLNKEKLPRNYSFTGDFLSFKRCARQYMIFRRHDFAPAQFQTMMFGSLIHSTVEDLHNLLIQRRAAQSETDANATGASGSASEIGGVS